MKLLIVRRGLTVRIVAFGLAVALFGSAFAQFGGRILPPNVGAKQKKYSVHSEIPSLPAVKVDTNEFFPRISQKLSGRKIKPANKSSRRRPARGIANNLRAGGIGGPSTSTSGPSFPGLGESFGWPPDPHMAAGPDKVVETVNSEIGFYSKTGTLLFQQAAEDFFIGLSGQIPPVELSFIFDPRVIYDQFNNRFVIIFDTLDLTGATNHMAVAVSDDSDPEGEWDLFAYNTKATIAGTATWLDYPQLGYNGDAIIISGNPFDFALTSSFGAYVLVIPSAGLYSGIGSAAKTFSLVNNFTVHPTSNYSPSSFIYAMEPSGDNVMTMFAFGNLTAATPTLQSVNVAIPQWNFAPGSPPSGGSGILDSLSPRMMNTLLRDNYVLGAHTIATPENRSMVRWYEFNIGTWPLTGTPTLEQSGNISGSTGQWMMMPAISKNSFGDISIIYTRSSSSIVSDLCISTRLESDPPGTIGSPILLRQGLSSNNTDRWGDYFACVIDPFDGFTFWGVGEVTGAGAWATEIQSWEVTVDTGTDYNPSIVLVAPIGLPAGGDIASIVTNDNTNYFGVNSVLLPGQGQYGAMEVQFFLAEDPDKMTSITFSIDSGLESGSNATGTLFLYNFATEKFDYAKAFPLKSLSGDAIQTFKLKSKFNDYVDLSGQVRMVLRAHEPFRRTGGAPAAFTLSSDWVHINVRSRP